MFRTVPLLLRLEKFAVLGFAGLSGFGVDLPRFVLWLPLERILDGARIDLGWENLVLSLLVHHFDEVTVAELQKVVAEVAADL